MALWSSASRKTTKETISILAYFWYNGTVLLVYDYLINSLDVTILREQTLVSNYPASAARTARQNWVKFYVAPGRRGWHLYKPSALQPVCTVNTRVHQKMLEVHHYERVHKGRDAESQGWARGQLKYHACLVLRSPKRSKKMAQFSPDFQVISKKKKVFTEIETVFLSKFRWSPKKKKNFTEIETVFLSKFKWSPKRNK